MSAERKAKGLMVAVVLWCVLIAIAGGAYKFLIKPYFSEKLETTTGSASPYDTVVKVAMDSFSGYCVLRSPAMRDPLKAERIKLDLVDDGADYEARMKALRAGQYQMAVFTIDSLLLTGARQGDFPVSIVLVLDETRGADAVVAYKDAVATIRDLDTPDGRIVLTPNSPSEFLARIVLAHFSLPSLPEQWAIEAGGAEEVYKQFRAAKGSKEKRAYVLWEPFVAKALKEPGAQVLIDSGKLRGYIVDVLVAERRFLAEKPEVAAKVVEAYLRAAYSYTGKEGGMAALVAADGSGMNPDEAKDLASKIQWKNTLENYAHFGLLKPEEMRGLPHIEDMMANITDVLVKTGALKEDPLPGKANTLYYDAIVRDLQTRGFHPGKALNLIAGMGDDAASLDAVRSDAELPALDDAQWAALIPVGELKVKPIVFARGGAKINMQSQRELDALAKTLQSFPQYYLMVEGHARAEGDIEAGKKLSLERAQAAADAIKALGIHPNRIHVSAAPPSDTNGAAQSVSFLVGQVGY